MFHWIDISKEKSSCFLLDFLDKYHPLRRVVIMFIKFLMKSVKEI